jgi:hypothetical protein
MSAADAIESNAVSMPGLARRVLASMSTSTRDELCEQAATCSSRLRATLESLFMNRFGGTLPGLGRLQLLFFMAPQVRQLVIGSANMNNRVRGTDITFADLKSWLEWLDAMDPLCARMIDLRYFAGVSVKETARLLDLRPHAVVRELRFARAWLNIKT